MEMKTRNILANQIYLMLSMVDLPSKGKCWDKLMAISADFPIMFSKMNLVAH